MKLRDLLKVEMELDDIEARAEILDPTHWHESKSIDCDLRALNSYISELEESLRQRRALDSHLRLVI